MNSIDPQALLADVLARVAAARQNSGRSEPQMAAERDAGYQGRLDAVARMRSGG